MYHNILVPLDGSALAEAALHHAEALALEFKSNITLLRIIISPYQLIAPDLVLSGTVAEIPGLRDQAMQYLQGVSGELREKGISFQTAILDGPVPDAITDYARAEHIDLIVMSTHGRGGISRWVYGSVAEKVLQAAPCPVLLIRASGK
ncbi:MAG: universal stress protein [Anaerolineae bacterium]|uniref:universal stress protein n=1 Tax=Candidatus Amarolinea dominans TaxID=3140696 RepID=UPI001DF865BA|nr:universal stress protein [Anaerolineae bacterium]MBK7199196.1 universal stress protein [Anaerolineae bacterium]MBK9095943.1 universal stress protein [Anaerolineae bacterium]MBK9229941.1 universal stress protein [Anaerolineae bacterium]